LFSTTFSEQEHVDTLMTNPPHDRADEVAPKTGLTRREVVKDNRFDRMEARFDPME